MNYSELIIDVYKNPQHKKRLVDATVSQSGANVTCGDRVRMYARLENNTIAECSFEAEGCAISLAAADLLCSGVAGKKPAEIAAMGLSGLSAILEFEPSPARVKCALLPLETLQLALQKDLQKNQ